MAKIKKLTNYTEELKDAFVTKAVIRKLDTCRTRILTFLL